MPKIASISRLIFTIAIVATLLGTVQSADSYYTSHESDTHSKQLVMSSIQFINNSCSQSSMVRDCGIKLVCIAGKCSYCNETEQCSSGMICKSESSSFMLRGVCERPPLFPNFTARDAITTILLVLASIIASGGGLGGGSVFVPVLIMVSGLTSKEAVPVSQAMIFGGAIANFVTNIRQSHPASAERPLIDFDASLLVAPLQLAGTIIGVMINTTAPQWLVVVLLVIISVYMTRKTFKKGRVEWIKEKNLLKKSSSSSTIADRIPIVHEEVRNDEDDEEDDNKEELAEADISTDISLPASPSEDSNINRTLDDVGDIGTPILSQSQSDVLKHERQILRPLLQILGIWTVVSIFAIIRGGQRGGVSVANVSTCSSTFWAITIINFLVLVLFTIFISRSLLKLNRKKVVCGYKAIEGDVQWNFRNIIRFDVFALLAGLVGSAVGIGGGMIMGPLLLELGMRAKTTSATSALAVLITSSSAIVQYIFVNSLLYSYAWWYFLMGLIATFIGQTTVAFLVRKYQRTSIIIFSMACLFLVATLSMTTMGIVNFVNDIKSGAYLGFTPYC